MFLILFFRSPGWRPTFKYYNRWLSLLGTVICLAVMFLMDYRTAIATYIIILLLYIVIHNRNPEANWGSSAQSLTFLQALRSVHTLAQVDDHVKNYRPKVKFCQISDNIILYKNDRHFFIFTAFKKVKILKFIKAYIHLACIQLFSDWAKTFIRQRGVGGGVNLCQTHGTI